MDVAFSGAAEKPLSGHRAPYWFEFYSLSLSFYTGVRCRLKFIFLSVDLWRFSWCVFGPSMRVNVPCIGDR